MLAVISLAVIKEFSTTGTENKRRKAQVTWVVQEIGQVDLTGVR